jgi:hypothetical protein
MPGTNVRRGHNIPSTVIPDFGKVSNDTAESSKSKSWAVLHEHESRSYFANDSGHLSP